MSIGCANYASRFPARPSRFSGDTIWYSRSDRKSTRLNSSHSQISYAVFCLKKKINNNGVCRAYGNGVTHWMLFYANGGSAVLSPYMSRLAGTYQTEILRRHPVTVTLTASA